MKEVVVEVVDSVMGSSKTTECFNWINKNPNDKYLRIGHNILLRLGFIVIRYDGASKKPPN